jgi:hypothetical protein
VWSVKCSGHKVSGICCHVLFGCMYVTRSLMCSVCLCWRRVFCSGSTCLFIVAVLSFAFKSFNVFVWFVAVGAVF